jgi:hypothetical protein
MNPLLNNVVFSGEGNRVGLPTRILNRVANFCLTPARYLLKGKTATCVQETSGEYKVRIHHSNEGLLRPIADKTPNFIKTIGAMVLFVPGLVVGGLIKGPLLLCSPKLHRRYETLNAQINQEASKLKHKDRLDNLNLLLIDPKKNKVEIIELIDQISNSDDLGDFQIYVRSTDLGMTKELAIIEMIKQHERTPTDDDAVFAIWENAKRLSPGDFLGDVDDEEVSSELRTRRATTRLFEELDESSQGGR